VRHFLSLGLVGSIAFVVLGLGPSPALATLTLPTPSPSVPVPVPSLPVPVPSLPAVTPPPVSPPVVSVPAVTTPPVPAAPVPVPVPAVSTPATTTSVPVVGAAVTRLSGGGSGKQGSGSSSGSPKGGGGTGRVAESSSAGAAQGSAGSSSPAAGAASPAASGVAQAIQAAPVTALGTQGSVGRLRGAPALAVVSWRSASRALSTSQGPVDDYLLRLVHDDLCRSLASILGPLPPRIDGLPGQVIRRLPASVRQVVPLDVLSRANVTCEAALFDVSASHVAPDAKLLALIRTGFMGLTLVQLGLGLLCIGAMLRHHGRRRPAAALPV
jgi:hypothetical protein